MLYEFNFRQFLLDLPLKLWYIPLIFLLLIVCNFDLSSELLTQLLLYHRRKFILQNYSAFRQRTLLCFDIYFEILVFGACSMLALYRFDTRFLWYCEFILHLVIDIDCQFATITQNFICLLSHHSILLFFKEGLTKIKSFINVFELWIIVDFSLHLKLKLQFAELPFILVIVAQLMHNFGIGLCSFVHILYGINFITR